MTLHDADGVWTTRTASESISFAAVEPAARAGRACNIRVAEVFTTDETGFRSSSSTKFTVLTSEVYRPEMVKKLLKLKSQRPIDVPQDENDFIAWLNQE